MRIWSPDNVYFVTNRCEQERLLLLPTAAVLSLIGSWLAKSLEEHGDGIELYGFIFLSNHFHLLLKDTRGKLAEFMWYFQLNLAKSVNRLLKRRGHFFAREYDAAPVLTEKDFDNRYAYILTNAVKAGLVARAADAPFFSSLHMALHDRTLSFEWLDKTKLHDKTRRGQKVDPAEVTKTYTLELAIPDHWKALDRSRRARRVRDLVKANEERYGKARRSEGRTVLGVRRMMAQSPFMRPRNPARSPRVKVFCQDEELAREYLETVKAVTGAYREALDGFLKAAGSGRRPLVEWPPGTYPPSSMAPVGA